MADGSIGDTLPPNMVWIPCGTFRMGSDRHYPEEAPPQRHATRPTPGAYNFTWRRFLDFRYSSNSSHAWTAHRWQVWRFNSQRNPAGLQMSVADVALTLSGAAGCTTGVTACVKAMTALVREIRPPIQKPPKSEILDFTRRTPPPYSPAIRLFKGLLCGRVAFLDSMQ
jgi:hypothetical protein